MAVPVLAGVALLAGCSDPAQVAGPSSPARTGPAGPSFLNGPG